ncbi:MAG: tetratricopeptide repeat protein [Pirellulales bacterium]
MRPSSRIGVGIVAAALSTAWTLPGMAQTKRAASAPKAPAAEGPKSSPAAIQQYRAAVALQNREVLDLAVDEWAKFLKDHAADPLAPKAQHYFGVCQLKLAKYADAEQAFTKVLTDHPKFELAESAWHYLGLAQYDRGRFAEKPDEKKAALERSAETFAKLAAAYPEGPHTAQALFLRGESQYLLERRDEAIKSYRDQLEKFPRDASRPDVLYALGVAQQESGQNDAAAATFDAFLKDYAKHKDQADVVLRRGDLLLAAGKPKEAAERFAAAAAAPGFERGAQALLRLGAAQFQQQQYPQAAATYAKVVEKFPQAPEAAAARLSAGNSLYLAGDYGKARQWFAQALSAGGDVAAEAAHWTARSYLKEGKPAEALAAADKALATTKSGPHHVSLLLDRADALYEQPEKRKEAAALFSEIAAKYAADAQAPQALYMAGFSALGASDYSTARDSAVQFLETHANHSLAPDVNLVLAEAQLQLQEYDRAAALFDKLAKANPERPEADAWKVRSGLALFLAKKYPQAIAALEAVLPKLKSPDAQAEAHYIVGSALVEQGEAAPAAAQLEAALAAQPKARQADEILLALARALRLDNKLPESAAAAQRVISEYPQSKLLDRAWFRLGEAAYAAGDYPKAAGAYDQVLSKWPQSELTPHVLFGLGWVRLVQNQPKPAEELFTRLIENHQKHELAAKAHYGRAVAREQLEQFEAAIADLQIFLAGKPALAEQLDAEYVRGLCLVGLGRSADAAKLFAAILEKDPKYHAADKVLYEAAWALKAAKEPAGAQELFALLAKTYPQSNLAAESQYHVAEGRYEAKDYAAAADTYRAVLAAAKQPELIEKAAHKLGWALYQKEDFAGAQAAFKRQLEAKPSGELAADGRFMQAECLFKAGEFEPALAAYKQAAGTQTSNKEFGALALLHAGQAAAQLKQWDEAGKLLETLGDRHADSAYLPEAWYELGWVRQNQERPDEALPLYEKAAEATNREVGARARFMMGEIYFAKKDHKEAVRQFFKAAYGYNAPRWQADATFEAARCFEVLENVPQAKKSYQELLEKFPQSDKAAAAKQRLEKLGG